jgi:hypothetical protein
LVEETGVPVFCKFSCNLFSDPVNKFIINLCKNTLEMQNLNVQSSLFYLYRNFDYELLIQYFSNHIFNMYIYMVTIKVLS